MFEDCKTIKQAIALLNSYNNRENKMSCADYVYDCWELEGGHLLIRHAVCQGERYVLQAGIIYACIR